MNNGNKNSNDLEKQSNNIQIPLLENIIDKKTLSVYQNFQNLVSPKSKPKLKTEFSSSISSKNTKGETFKHSRVLSQDVLKYEGNPLNSKKKSTSHKTFYSNNINNINEYGLNKINLPPNPPKLLHLFKPKKNENILTSIKEQINKLKDELTIDNNKKENKQNNKKTNTIDYYSPSNLIIINSNQVSNLDNTNIVFENIRNNSLDNNDLRNIIDEHHENIQNIMSGVNENYINVIYKKNNTNYSENQNNNYNTQKYNINNSNENNENLNNLNEEIKKLKFKINNTIDNKENLGHINEKIKKIKETINNNKASFSNDDLNNISQEVKKLKKTLNINQIKQ